MTSASIPGIHSRSNPYYSVLSGSSSLFPYHRGELQGLYQFLICPIAHQYSIGACQLHAFEAAPRVPRSILQSEAVNLQTFVLLQQAEPAVFPWTYGAYGKCPSKGCWHTTGVTLRKLSSPLELRRRRYSCS